MKKSRFHIIYPSYLSRDGKRMLVGGVETYISNLIELIKDKNYEISLYQAADFDFHINIDGLDVYATAIEQDKNIAQELYNKCKEFLKEEDVIIFGTDTIIVKTDSHRTIAVQHGVFWDIPQEKNDKGELAFLKSFFTKGIAAWKRNKRIKYANKIVCVDHNFVNWYRAVVPFSQTCLTVIPNFTAIPEERKYEEKKDIKIIFARRFVKYRGTHLFANIIERILEKYNNVYVTFAGEGPEEQYIRNKFESNKKVTVTKYSSSESIEIHSKHDIAVVPTIGSEGTSLSLLEAMAAGCAVICSNVGGMTNIVLDGFNGLIFDPYNEEELYNAIARMIDDENFRIKVARNAYTTVKESFSLQIWRDRWSKVIDDIIK